MTPRGRVGPSSQQSNTGSPAYATPGFKGQRRAGSTARRGKASPKCVRKSRVGPTFAGWFKRRAGRVRGVNYWERYIGAIRKKTGRLDLTEKGAYDVLLDEYYALEAPLPADFSELYRIANAQKKHERDAVRKVADLYFPVGPDGLRHNERADYEIAERSKAIEAAKENGAKGGRPRKSNLPGNPPGSEEETRRVPNGFLYGNPDHNPGHNPDPNPIESSTYNKPQSLPIGKGFKS
jgi:uncharacterized protein YdaU (DUF1376 family)